MKEKQAVTPTALTPGDVSRMLSAALGRKITAEMIEHDINHGAPTNGDGTVNIVHYGAWLISQRKGGRPAANGN